MTRVRMERYVRAQGDMGSVVRAWREIEAASRSVWDMVESGV